MAPMGSPRHRSARAVVAFAGLALLAAGTAAATAAAAPVSAAPAGAGSPNVLKDRVLAVVDDDPILSSDLDRAIAVGQLHANAGEVAKTFRRRVLDDLVAQRLRFHEIDRFGLEQVPVDQIEKHVAEVRARFKDETAFRQQLKEVGLDEAALRQMMARQLEVLAFVDERLGPQVFVGLDEIAAYYRNVLTPQMQKQHQAVPPLDDVREQIREVLRQQRLTEEIDRWTEELRRKASIVLYFDQPAGGPLPPVVKRIELGKKPEAPPIPAGGAPAKAKAAPGTPAKPASGAAAKPASGTAAKPPSGPAAQPASGTPVTPPPG
jgi:peptidyl-prolyl cis-trans isomerase SurA